MSAVNHFIFTCGSCDSFILRYVEIGCSFFGILMNQGLNIGGGGIDCIYTKSSTGLDLRKLSALYFDCPVVCSSSSI